MAHRLRAWALLLSAGAAALSSAAPALPVKLGVYDFMVQESSPVVFNGRLLMVESMLDIDPEFVPLCGEGNSTLSYFRVRDQPTGAVLVNISATCGFAFASGWAVTNDEGIDTLFIYGTSGRSTGTCSGAGVNCR
jgi:hypothetical protein